MSHFAKVLQGMVIDVIVAEQDYIDTLVDRSPGEWVQTSYNTRGGIHYNPETMEPSEDQSKALRKNYAGVGMLYDADRDAFYTKSPHTGWVLNEQTCLWEAPTAPPNDGKLYNWNDETETWVVKIEPGL